MIMEEVTSGIINTSAALYLEGKKMCSIPLPKWQERTKQKQSGKQLTSAAFKGKPDNSFKAVKFLQPMSNQCSLGFPTELCRWEMSAQEPARAVAHCQTECLGWCLLVCQTNQVQLGNIWAVSPECQRELNSLSNILAEENQLDPEVVSVWCQLVCRSTTKLSSVQYRCTTHETS